MPIQVSFYILDITNNLWKLRDWDIKNRNEKNMKNHWNVFSVESKMFTYSPILFENVNTHVICLLDAYLHTHVWKQEIDGAKKKTEYNHQHNQIEEPQKYTTHSAQALLLMHNANTDLYTSD